MMTGWRNVPFESVVADASAGNVRTLQSEFLRSGRYPVVDQGMSLVAGYADDAEKLCDVQLPVIVFGDHTRCLKFIDFPFCIGADGVKVLRPKEDLDAKYLYHYLRQLRLTDGGYARHFKYLKRNSVLLPPLDEQQRIAAILDRADALRAMRRAALAQLDTLTQSIFLDLFGDPATNPKVWPVRAVGDLIESATYGTSEKSELKGEIPVLRMNNITRSGGVDLSNLKYMSLSDHERERCLVRAGDILFNRTNSADLVGKSAIYREVLPMAYAGYLIRLRANRENDPEYLAGFLNTGYAKRVLRGMCKSIIGMANINATEIKAMRIAQPPLRAQREFARRIGAVEGLRTSQRASIAEMNRLFAAIQHRAFRGEL